MTNVTRVLKPPKNWGYSKIVKKLAKILKYRIKSTFFEKWLESQKRPVPSKKSHHISKPV